MKTDEFLILIKEQIEDNDVDINFETNYTQLKSWDSLTAMLVLSSIKEKFGVDISMQELKSCITIGDIYRIGINKIKA